MSYQPQVVIVGAGPSGAAAAVRFAQRGLTDVLLLDKDHFPREKTCGSGLSPGGIKLARELGIGDEIDRLGYWVDGLLLKTPGNRVMRLESPNAAVVLLRKHFDNLLVERAQHLGIPFRQGFRVTELARDGERIVGVRAKDEEIRARYVLVCDGAHSIFSTDPRPKKTISTLMGWWENFDFEPHMMEMIFDKKLSPLYGWMFPETDSRVNIGICIDGEDSDGNKTQRNVRQVFAEFLDDHYGDRLRTARQIGKFKGHPISYTTWIQHATGDGVLFTGEAARITHNATGEGIYQAMQSGCYAADALADVIQGRADEKTAWRRYTWQLRRKFTTSFLMGHALRGILKTPLLDGVALAYNSPTVRRVATSTIGWAMTGGHVGNARAGVAPTAAAERVRATA